MNRILLVLFVGSLASLTLLAVPAAMSEPRPVALPVITMSISDGNGGKDKLQMYGMLQPKSDSHVGKVKARVNAIALALKTRMKLVKSTDLIPPNGNTEWVETELWNIAEGFLKPIQLDGAFFTELSIE